MDEISTFEKFLWPITMLPATGLAALILWRRNYKAYPLFLVYILAVLAQNLAFVLSYQLLGFGSAASFTVAWITQSMVIAFRALAIIEIFRHVLAEYAGIWALVRRILLASAVLVLTYAWAVGGHSWRLAVVTAHRGLELAMAVGILAVLVFAHYYQVVVKPTARFLAMGFFLYSSFQVLNDTVLERWLTHYAALWNFLGTLAFLASLLLWMWALRQTLPAMAPTPVLLPENDYRVLSPAINARLKALNEQLIHFGRTEGEKT